MIKAHQAPHVETTDRLLREFKRLDLLNQGKPSMKISMTHNVFHYRLTQFDRLIRERSLRSCSNKFRRMVKFPPKSILAFKPYPNPQGIDLDSLETNRL